MIDEVRRVLEQHAEPSGTDRYCLTLRSGRTQTIRVDDKQGVVRLSSVVASARALADSPEGAFQLLRLNRFTELVEFTIDGRGRWIAESELPPGPMSDAEIAEHIRALTVAADRTEQIVSGSDAY